MFLNTSFFDTWTPRVLSLLRFVAGMLIMIYGMAKTFHVPYIAMFDGVQVFSMTGAAGLIELIGGFLLMIGLLTRPAAFILSGEMAFAYFIGHAAKGNALLPILNGGMPAVLFSFIFFYLAFAGGGVWSIDVARRRKEG